jgi:hypothetical protein
LIISPSHPGSPEPESGDIYYNTTDSKFYKYTTSWIEATPTIFSVEQYDPTKDETVFISLPEGTNRPITSIKNRIESNTIINYEDFIEDDGY